LSNNEAFSNLNIRFQQILHSSSFLYKIKFDHSTSDEIFKKNCRQILDHHESQIYSIHLYTEYYMDTGPLYFDLTSRNTHIESLILYDIGASLLHLLFYDLIQLPRLFSLKILHKQVLI
jgi:hypothetical protein